MTSHKTISTIVKEKIANMPDRFNDKEILNYIKEAIKEAKIDIKTKKVSTNNIDEQKQKYSLSAYQEFMKEQQIVFKNNFPNLSSKERFKKISEEWNKVKSYHDSRLNIHLHISKRSYIIVFKISVYFFF